MEFWPEFLASSCGREFVAGGVGGMAGVLAGHPLDTLRIRLQQPPPPVSPGITAARRPPSAAQLLRGILRAEGASALYRGMGAPLASVAFQNAMVFQAFAILSRSLDPESSISDPPSYTSVALAGVGTGALQTLILSPVELVKIRLQLEAAGHKHRRPGDHRGPADMARDILRKEGLRGIYRGLTVTALRDAPAHGVYFWTYEYARERLHPGCRRDRDESLATMLVSGGLAGVASWVCCYPLDVVKSRLQAQAAFPPRYRGVVDCFRKSVREEGLPVLWRGLGTAAAAKSNYMSAGQISVPIVFRGPNGAAAGVGAQHSQCYAAWYAHVPGLKVLTPYSAEDARGLLKAAIRDPDPVVFLENELLYGESFPISAEVLDSSFCLPIGKAKIERQGKDVTITAFSKMVGYALQAADILAKEGISAEVINLRSIRPLDRAAINASVRKTNRLVTVEEGFPQHGVGAEICMSVVEDSFEYLDAPVERIAGADVPMPYAANLERMAVPQVEDIVRAAKRACYRAVPMAATA